MTTLPTRPATRQPRTCLADSTPPSARARWLREMWITAGPGAPISASSASRIGWLLYGLVCYLVFFLSFLYAAGFVGGFLTPTSLDGPRVIPLWQAMAIDVALLLLFAVQHSVMARPWFKKWWTQYVPVAAERSTYVLFSSLALIALFAFWQPIGGVVWDIQNPFGRAVMYLVFATGWLTVLVTTFLINHFDLFGLRQVWHHFRSRASGPLNFTMPGPYKVVRHPLYVGWLLGFWGAPTMTWSHFLFAAITTAYILAAIRWEERDLVTAHPEYEEYRRKVGMLTPKLR